MHMHDRINALRTAIDTGAIIPCRVNMLLELDRLIASVPAKARGVQRQTGKLTIASIKAIKAKGRYSDGHGMSLNVRERKGGKLTSTFEQVLRLEAGGRFTTIKIGTYPDIDLDTARIRCQANRAALALNHPLPYGPTQRRVAAVPVTETISTPDAVTFRMAVASTMAEVIEPGFKSGTRSAATIANMLETYAMPALGDRAVADLRTEEIVPVIKAIWWTKHPTAKQLLLRLRQVFGFVRSQGIRTDNPLEGELGLPKVKHTTKHLDSIPASEIRDVIAQLDAYGIKHGRKLGTVLALQFITSTPLRSRQEVRMMKWGEIEGRTWTVPGARMKTAGDGAPDYSVPLSPFAMAIIERARATHPGTPAKSDPVFRNGDFRKHFGESAMIDVLRDIGRKETVHGLRGTFRMWAKGAGIDGTVAEMCLAHEQRSQVEKTYERSDWYSDRAEVFGQWSDYLTGTAQ